MANQEQLELLKRSGIDVWNKWRLENREVKIDLSDAIFIEDNFDGINLRDARLYRADFSEGSLVNADLSGSKCRGINLSQTFLTSANLHGIDLWNANLNMATLYETNLKNAFLNSANLMGANLTKSDLRKANLNYADLSGAILVEADLDGANLFGANFISTNLKNTSFSGTIVGYTFFGSNDLSEIIDIEKVVHRSKSILGTETIKKSRGKIPEIFLRGCGLSDLEIEFAKLATLGLDPEQVTEITYKINQLYLGGGIQYYSCFISYASKDQVFAQRLYDDLQNNGVRCWFAPEDMKIGDQIRPKIDQEIRLRDKLLVILSENSVKSEWVGDEVEAALEEESASDRLVLFPIRLDDAVMETRDDWAAKIKRRRHIGDFSNWKDEGSYQKAFGRLLRDLKAGGE